MKAYVFFIFWLCIFSSCNKFLDVKSPVTQVETGQVFADNNTATSAVAGLYAQMISGSNSFFSGAITSYTGLSADELINPSNSNSYSPYQKNELLPTTTSLPTLWATAYGYIYQANSILEGLQKSASLSQATKDSLRGEILFSRSILYFYLINIWGDMPFVTSTDYTLNAALRRTPVNDILKQLEIDLLEAKKLLQNTSQTPNKTRPGKWAAGALLARLYLYEKKWAEAIAQSSEVIASSGYSMEANVNAVFTSASRETIWQLAKANANTAEGSFFIPISTTSLPTFCATEYLLNSFETNDARKTNWLKANTVGGKQFLYPYKYKVRSSTSITEYYVVLRMAEQYLIKAEASAMTGDPATAVTSLNVVRNRAGLGNSETTSSEDILAAIAKERQTEFFAEWGHRWFDLKRTGKANEVLSVRKAPTWQASDALYPIPIAQLDKNPGLTQNPGYTN